MKSLKLHEAISLTRRLGAAALLFTLVTASYGCLDDVTLCDGSDDIRLAYRTVGGNPFSEQRVLFENGYSYLYVDGQCRYWAYPGEGTGTGEDPLSDVVTGTLTAEQESQIKEDLDVVEWQRWDGESFHESGLMDGGTAIFWMPSAAYHCYGDCQSSLRNDIRKNVRRWIGKLIEEGDPVEGAVRVAAIVMPESVLRQNRPHPVQPAPAGFDLQEHAVSIGDASSICAGDGILVEGEAADTLRRYRREYQNEEHGAFWYRYLPLEDEEGQQYMVYVRDATPLEDANGLVQLAGESRETCFRD